MSLAESGERGESCPHRANPLWAPNGGVSRRRKLPWIERPNRHTATSLPPLRACLVALWPGNTIPIAQTLWASRPFGHGVVSIQIFLTFICTANTVCWLDQDKSRMCCTQSHVACLILSALQSSRRLTIVLHLAVLRHYGGD